MFYCNRRYCVGVGEKDYLRILARLVTVVAPKSLDNLRRGQKFWRVEIAHCMYHRRRNLDCFLYQPKYWVAICWAALPHPIIPDLVDYWLASWRKSMRIDWHLQSDTWYPESFAGYIVISVSPPLSVGFLAFDVWYFGPQVVSPK